MCHSEFCFRLCIVRYRNNIREHHAKTLAYCFGIFLSIVNSDWLIHVYEKCMNITSCTELKTIGRFHYTSETKRRIALYGYVYSDCVISVLLHVVTLYIA